MNKKYIKAMFYNIKILIHVKNVIQKILKHTANIVAIGSGVFLSPITDVVLTTNFPILH